MVLLPDSALLMCYGLIPRTLMDGSVSWDDPSKPIYEVLRVTPLSAYSVTAPQYSTARISIRRDYFEDYLSLKGCVAVAAYFEERYSDADQQIELVLAGEAAVSFSLPGRRLTMQRSRSSNGVHLCQVRGASLLLFPSGRRPVTEEAEPILTWPGIGERDGVRLSRSLSLTEEFVCVQDLALKEYEERDEFVVHPDSGGVQYGGWWSVGNCRRTSRNYIEVHLRKLYEGTPSYVIRHFNRFAVAREIAESDREVSGARHVGQRAGDVIVAFLRVTEALAMFSDGLGASSSQGEFGRLSTEAIRYSGWWTFAGLKPIGRVLEMSLSQTGFLHRCTELFKVLENLQTGALRELLLGMGAVRKDITTLGPLRLLATLCQLITIARADGLSLVSEFDQVYGQWRASVTLPDLAPLFALNGLRVLDSHTATAGVPEKTHDALATLGIDPSDCKSGWGRAADRVYDRLASSLNAVAALIEDAPM